MSGSRQLFFYANLMSFVGSSVDRCTVFVHEKSEHLETWKGRKVVYYPGILLFKEWIILVLSFLKCQKRTSIGKENVNLPFTY